MIWCFARWERERREVDAKRNKHRERVGDMEWDLSFPSLPTQWGYGPEAAFDVRVKLALLWLISALEYLPNVSIWVLWSVFIVFEDKSISFTHMASSVWCSSKEIKDLFWPWDIMVGWPSVLEEVQGCFWLCVMLSLGTGFGPHPCASHEFSSYSLPFMHSELEIYRDRYIDKWISLCIFICIPMYLYFLTVAGILLSVFSLQYILYFNYYITLLLSGRNLSVKTTALSWSFQTLLLDPAGVCVWLSFYELCLLMVTFSGSNIWVTSQDSNFFLASWPQKGILAFPSLEDCQCWPLGQRLALMLRPHWFLRALLSGFDERLFTLPYSMGKKRNA